MFDLMMNTRCAVDIAAAVMSKIVVIVFMAMAAVSSASAEDRASAADSRRHTESSARLALNSANPKRDAWPAATFLTDPEKILSVENVMATPGAFAISNAAYATLGWRKDAVWMRIPVAVAAGEDADWVLSIDYSLLKRIDVYVVHGGEVVQRALLGNSVPRAARPINGRIHAVALSLHPGSTDDIFLRVEAMGAMIIPISISQFSAFHNSELNEQMLQGALISLALFLMLASLSQWFSVHESLYLKYCLFVMFSTVFSMHFFGIGSQYLWTDNLWMERHMAGFTALLTSACAALFIEDALRQDLSHKLRLAIFVTAAVLILAALAHIMDLLDIRQVGMVMSTVAVMPMLIALPGTLKRLWRGDHVAMYLLMAWVVYFVARWVMIGVVKGDISVNFWTLHSFQFGCTMAMLVFMWIAVLRTRALHVAAQKAALERDILHSMAHTDPLTGLVNRRGLNVDLAHAITQCSPQKMLAVYMLDMDNFKPVNDQFGHDVGDELLMMAANRLRATLRTSEIVARTGGDEFVILATGLQHESQAILLGNKLLAIFAQPFMLNQQSCQIGITIGYSVTGSNTMSAASLLKGADDAMYSGKQSGKHCVVRGVGADEWPKTGQQK